MASIQMNVRIDENVKSTGDAVFARLGYTPTRVVRTMWECAARYKDAPDEIEALLCEAERLLSPDESDERARKLCFAEEGPRAFERFLAKVGIDETSLRYSESVSSATTREAAAVERAREKGWIDG